MKPIVILGIVLIIAGLIGLIYGGVTYTTQENVVNIGDLHVTAPKQHTIPISAIAGGLILAGGVAVVVVSSRKSA